MQVYLDLGSTKKYYGAAIIERNDRELAGKRVLGIASHDGRLSFAALMAGAAHVTGVEACAEVIASSNATFAHYGVGRASFRFEQDDVFDRLGIGDARFDVVLCLGFFYRIIKRAELLQLIERTGAGLVVIDAEATPAVDEVPVMLADQPPGTVFASVHLSVAARPGRQRADDGE